MEAKESYELRLEMAEMHEEFIERMSASYDNKYYIETVWYCYSIFEQRINRLISKYIDKCTLAPDRTDDKSISISTRIKCLKKIINAKYNSFELIDIDLLNRISDWCEKRNELVHSLISLKHYRKFDEEFKNLADLGVSLVFELYDVITTFRKKWYLSENSIDDFPVKKCRCQKAKCINASNL